jgi:hypothetical protein
MFFLFLAQRLFRHKRATNKTIIPPLPAHEFIKQNECGGATKLLPDRSPSRELDRRYLSQPIYDSNLFPNNRIENECKNVNKCSGINMYIEICD